MSESQSNNNNNNNNNNNTLSKTIYNLTSFKQIIEIWVKIFFPEFSLKAANNKKLEKVSMYANSILKIIMLIFILPAIPFIIILTICLEGIRYFYSKFIHL